MLLVLFSLFIFNYLKNKNYKEEESKFILENLIIMKDSKLIGNHRIVVDSSKNVIVISGKDSVYFKFVDNKPIFSLSSHFEGLGLYMHDNDSLETLFDYKQDTLNLNFKNKNLMMMIDIIIFI